MILRIVCFFCICPLLIERWRHCVFGFSVRECIRPSLSACLCECVSPGVHWLLITLDFFLSNQWKFHHTLVDDVVQATGEPVRF